MQKDILLKKALDLLVEISVTYDLSEHSSERRILCNEIRKELCLNDNEELEED